MNTKPLYLQELHHLRGVAILMIVAAHCYQFFGWNNHLFAEAIFKDVFDNSSLIFIFVSGFLFQFTEERRFSFTKFFFRKTQNILFPYLIALVPAIMLFLLRGSQIFTAEPLQNFSVIAKILYQFIYPGQLLILPCGLYLSLRFTTLRHPY